MTISNVPHPGRFVRHLGLPLLLLILWDFLIVVAYKVLGWEWVASDKIPLALYGSLIGIVVGFRNNSAYARWWEARKLWGEVVNNSRSLARQILATMYAGPEMAAIQRRIIHYQIAYVHALRQQLRRLDPVAEIQRLLSSEGLSRIARDKNIPLALQREMALTLREARKEGWVDQWEWQSIDRTLQDVMGSQGGTERIKNTPLPKQYDFFVALSVNVYCLLLPAGMVQDLGWFTPLGSTLVGFLFLALDKIGRSLEDPFDNKVFDVPLTSITRTIEINLRQMLGETDLPEPETAVHGVLW